jgi:hypothetical protein
LEFIGGLRAGHTVRVAIQPGFDHIGEKHAAQPSIERWKQGGAFAHNGLLERLPAAQEFAVDLGDRFQDFAGPAIVGNELGNLGVRFLGQPILAAAAFRGGLLGPIFSLSCAG